MKFIDDIFSFVWDIYDFFYDAYLETKEWLIVGTTFSTICLAISDVFWDLLTPIAHFGDWVDDVATKVANILNWDNIKELVLSWIPDLEGIVSWFQSRLSWFTTQISNWWSIASLTVQSWITTATQGLSELLIAWNNFWTITLPTLISSTGLAQWWASRLLDIQTIVNSAFTTRQSLWSGWQEIRDQVVEFFTDPVKFIWDKFTDWFLGVE